MLRTFKQALDDFRGALRSQESHSEAPLDDSSGAEAAPVTPPTLPVSPAVPLATDATIAPAGAVAQPAVEPQHRGARVYSVSGDALPTTLSVPNAQPAAPARRKDQLRRSAPLVFVALTALGMLAWRLVPWPVREPADPQVVVTYQGGTITRDQLKQQFTALPPEDQPLYQSLDGLKIIAGDQIVQDVTRRWAEEKQVDQQGAFTEAMKHATQQIQIEDVSDQLHQGKIPVGEAEIQAYYDQNRQQFGEQSLTEVKDQIRQIVIEQKEQGYVDTYLKDLKERASLQVDYNLLDVPEPTEQELTTYYQANRAQFAVPEQAQIAQIQVSISLAGGDAEAKAKAETARARAAAGEDVAALAQELSDGPEKTQGGKVADLVARGSRAAEFDAAVFVLNPGDLSPVFKEGDSYYVVKLEQRTPQRQRPFEEVRAEIANTLRAEREQQVYEERKDRTLFTIHSRRTTLGEFIQELKELPPEAQASLTTTDGKRKILDSFIERLLVVEDAAEQATDVKRQGDIERTRSDLLAQLLHQEEVDEKAKATDEEVRAAYDQSPQRYADPPRVKVRYIRVSRGASQDEDTQARAKIDEAAAKITPGGIFNKQQPADFGEIAKQYSEDTDTAANGGQLDQWIGESGDPFTEAYEHALHEQLLPLNVGDVSPVMPLGDSYYLFQVQEKQNERQRSFEEAKDLVRQDLETQKHEELTATMEQELFKRMQVQFYDRRLSNVLAELGGPAADQVQGSTE